jgi:hypothetical protein
MIWFGVAVIAVSGDLVLVLREHVFKRRSPGVGAGARKGTAADAEETTALVVASDDLVLAAGDLREGVILLPGDVLQLEHEAASF